MTAIWSGVDPNHAEQALRALSRRLRELESALSDQRELLQARPDSFAFSLGYSSLVQLQERLLGERSELLKHRVAERVDVSLEGASFQKDGASAAALGALLIRLQKLYSSIAQAITEGPKLRGPIASAIMSATELRLAATFPSSFGMSLIVERGPMDGEVAHLPSASLERMFGLLKTEQTALALMQTTGELGGRVLNHYRHIANILQSTESDLKVEWSDSEGIKHYWLTSSESAGKTVSLLKSIQEVSSETNTVIGRLVGASLLRNRFELLADDGRLLEGKVTGNALRTISTCFGKVVNAELDMTTVRDQGSGEARTYYALVSIDPS